MKRFFPIILSGLLLAGCSDSPQNATKLDQQPKIYPDYIGVTIPAEIAPLNFNFLGGEYSMLDLVIRGSKGGELHTSGKTIDIDIDDWHELTKANVGGTLECVLSVKVNGEWKEYKSFEMTVSPFALDEWGVTYRRIAPGYMLFGKMGLYQRNLSNFDEYTILDNEEVPGACMNCHTSNRTNPDNFTFHIRGANGATIVQSNGKHDCLDTKTDKTLGTCVYPYWHPSGKYIAFSTNSTHQAFHSVRSKLVEVYDEGSDLQIYDVERKELIISPLVKTKDWMESYPTFSPDGKTIYFCTAFQEEIPDGLKNIKYNICKIDFDPVKGEFGNKVDTIFDARKMGKSAVHPRPSYDGKYLMFTICDYGCFPIWHKEADQWIMDLASGDVRPMTEANSDDSDSFHNWNVNSHWIVFTSRRDDGQFTRLYLCSVDNKGNISKPFMMPQRNPLDYYQNMMQAYNTPDFTAKPVEFDHVNGAKEILSNKRDKIKVKE